MRLKVTMVGYVEDPSIVGRFTAVLEPDDEDKLNEDLGAAIEGLMDDWREDPVVVADIQVVEDE